MTAKLNQAFPNAVDQQRRPSTEVIVCTYNGSRFIAEQLESIFAQRQKPDLISVYDDQSSDNTVAIVRQMIAQRAPTGVSTRIQVNHSNVGYASNFSNAIAEAQGDVLFLCDQDDRWHVDKIRVSLDLMQTARADMMFSDGLLIDAKGRPLAASSVLSSYGLSKTDIVKFSVDPVQYLVRRNYVNGAAIAIRRKAAQAALPVPAGMPHDYWLAIWCALHGGIGIAPNCLYEYRQHGGNVIGVGLHRWHHQWFGIWHQPRPPRLRELSLLSAFVPRIQGMPPATAFDEKLQWMEACVAQKERLVRLSAILRSALLGRYRRFGAPYALARDLVSILRPPT